LGNHNGDAGLVPCDVSRVQTLLDSACFLLADLGWTAYRTCYAAGWLEHIGSRLALIVACLIGIVLILASAMASGLRARIRKPREGHSRRPKGPKGRP
jgi:hypothetical protein